MHRSVAPSANARSSKYPVQPKAWAKRLIGSMRKRASKYNSEQITDAEECYLATCKEVDDGWAIGSEAGTGGTNKGL